MTTSTTVKKKYSERDKKSSKKRTREEDDETTDAEPKLKKSKSASVLSTETARSGGAQKKEKKKKTKRDDDGSMTSGGREEKKKKKKKKGAAGDGDHYEGECEPPAEFMDIDVAPLPCAASRKLYQPPDTPAEVNYPFFSQTICTYEPLYPIGWAQPVTSASRHILEPLRNKYVPKMRGVLIDYSNVSMGPAPHACTSRTDTAPTTLVSFNEYAVGFTYLTADVLLFKPARGAWMEGLMHIQTEGHVGLVCFGRYNAAIETNRLPADWRWIKHDDDADSDAEVLLQAEERYDDDAVSLDSAAQMHGFVRHSSDTGHWVDAEGVPITGRLRFRIRNWDAGISGNVGYLSLEGSMLDIEAEKRLLYQESLVAGARKARKLGLNRDRIRGPPPEFSMTHFMTSSSQETPSQQSSGARV